AELSQLERSAKDFEALGVKLVAVSSDRLDELRPFKRKHNWAITLVADPELAIHRLYNVQQRNFTPRRGPFRDLAIPTTILIDRDGRILWLDQATDFRVRPQAALVLAKTRSLLAKSQPNAEPVDACERLRNVMLCRSRPLMPVHDSASPFTILIQLRRHRRAGDLREVWLTLI